MYHAVPDLNNICSLFLGLLEPEWEGEKSCPGVNRSL